jgi:hypothetical protein
LAFLDDDDLWAPTWLRTALDTARRCDAGAAYGGHWSVDSQRRVTGVRAAHRAAWVRDGLCTHNAIGGPSGVLVRADTMTEAGGCGRAHHLEMAGYIGSLAINANSAGHRVKAAHLWLQPRGDLAGRRVFSMQA